MKIDWFTVVAQIINFLVLVWLLKRFLYKPILDAIEDREKQITLQLEQAKTEKMLAKKEQEEFLHKNALLDQNHSMLMSKAIEDANEEGKRMMEDMQKATELQRISFAQSLDIQKQKFNKEFILQSQQQVFKMVRKTLSDLASVNLEERMIDVFLLQLDSLEKDKKEQMTLAINHSKEPLVIATSFLLTTIQKELIEKKVNRVFGANASFRYHAISDLIGGIELSTKDYKIAWTIADFIDLLEQGTGDWVKEHMLTTSNDKK